MGRTVSSLHVSLLWNGKGAARSYYITRPFEADQGVHFSDYENKIRADVDWLIYSPKSMLRRY